jgi:thiol-disulfide isomerase/thioredoxin
MAAAKSKQANPDLIEFYGTECVHCHEMQPLIEQLEKEEGIILTRLEVWHNSENAAIMQQCDDGKCGGVPFFFNKKTGKWICGSVDYEELKKWALDK